MIELIIAVFPEIFKGSRARIVVVDYDLSE